MAPDRSRSINTAIIVAIIGVAGVLGSAVIANWDKLLTKPATPTTETQPEPQKQSGVPVDQPAVKQDSTPTPTSENQDSVQVLAISPPTNDALPSNQPFAVTMRLHYRLVSADSVLLVPFLEQYAAGDQCASNNHRTIASNDPSQIPIKRGEGEVSVLFKVDPDKKGKPSDFGNEGYVAPNASFWAGFDSQGRVIVLQDMLWDSTKYCYRLGPR
jgi:hypothetical protein